MSIREDFHHLIDTIEDEQVLNGYYKLIQLNVGHNSSTWDTLTEEQQQDILQSYEESFDEKNLIPHEEVIKKLGKWLKP